MRSFLVKLLLSINFALSGVVLGCPQFEDVVPGGENSTNTNKKPELVLRIDQPKSELNQFSHELESNVVLVNMTGIVTLRLDCWAPYPIDLQFSGHLTNQETKVKTFRKEFGSGGKSQTCFFINATMESYEEITGNYSCISVENPRLISSYYIFVSPNPPGVLLTRGQKIVLQVKPQDKQVIFPCAVSHPDVHVHLLKEEGVLSQQIPLSPDLAYNPKLGFTLRISGRDSSVFGGYRCQTELSPKDNVEIILLPPKNFEKDPPIRHISLKRGEKLMVKCKAVDDFFIVANPSNISHVKNAVVLNESGDFYPYEGVYESEILPEHISSGYVECKWKDNNEGFATWTFSVVDTVKPGHLDTTKFKTECPKDSNNIIVFECNNFVECRINSCVRKDMTCQSNADICRNDEHCLHSGFVQCPTASVLEIFFTGFPSQLSANSNATNRYVEWDQATPDELLLLKETMPPYPSKSKSMKYSCQGSNFVFSSGFKWFLVHGNGSKSLLTSDEGNTMNVSVNNSWRGKKSILESTLELQLTSPVDKTVTHIECSAPVWNSFKWISRMLPIDSNKFEHKVLPGDKRKPRFNSANLAIQPQKLSICSSIAILLLLQSLCRPVKLSF